MSSTDHHDPLMWSARFRRLPIWHERDLPDPTDPHETRASSLLRPIVFGANDGLVSNLALVMGVAGANAAPGVILLAGIAGLLAGAFSMGVGEYISVQSQRELLEYQLAFQRHQIRETPDRERSILAGIYRERGFTETEATHFVNRVFANPAGLLLEIVTARQAHNVQVIGPPTTEFTWYQGYAWEVAYCASCHSHVGWAFGAVDGGHEPASFFGLLKGSIVLG